jgi:molecular chaperone DnaK
MNVGIDLGNSYCRISSVNSSVVMATAPDLSGSGIVPTPVAAVIDEGSAIVGRLARVIAQRNADAVLSRYSHGALEAQIAGTSPPNKYDPQLVAALLLKKLRLDVESTGASVDRAVLAIPSHLSEGACNALCEAASMADIQKLRLLDQALAVAKYYIRMFDAGGFLKDPIAFPLLVVDLGETTLKTALVDFEHGKMRVAASTTTNFGAKNIDARIARLIVDISSKSRIDLYGPDLRTVEDLAEGIRLEFSGSSPELIRRDAVLAGVPVRLVLLREEIEDILREVFEQMESEIVRCLSGGSLERADVRTVALAGGFCAFLVERLKRCPERWAVLSRQPTECVCLGAALEANDLSEYETSEPAAVKPDIAVRAIDPGTGEVVMDKIVDRNLSGQDCATREYHKSHPSQTHIVLELFELHPPEQLAASLGRMVIPVESLPVGVGLQVTFAKSSGGGLRIGVAAPRARIEMVQEFQSGGRQREFAGSRLSLVRSATVIS